MTGRTAEAPADALIIDSSALLAVVNGDPGSDAVLDVTSCGFECALPWGTSPAEPSYACE